MKKFERIAAVVALVTIILAWVVGALRQEADLIPFIKKALPGAVYLESVSNGIYAGKASNQTGTPVLGYAAIDKAGGYGGPMQVAVGVNSAGDIIGIYAAGSGISDVIVYHPPLVQLCLSFACCR